jgi:hypothetical protein
MEELRASLDNLTQVVIAQVRLNLSRLLALAFVLFVLAVGLLCTSDVEPVTGEERISHHVESYQMGDSVYYHVVAETTHVETPEEREIKELRRRARRLDEDASYCSAYRPGTIDLAVTKYHALHAGAACRIAASTLRREARELERELEGGGE